MESLEFLRDKMHFLSALEIANAVPVLFVIYQKGKATTTDINRLLARDLGFSLSGGSLNNTLFSLSAQNFIKIEAEYSGKKLLRRKYSLSEKGKKLIKALIKFLDALESDDG